MPDGQYKLGSHTVTKCLGGVRLPDGTLAGSTLTMDQALRNLVKIGLPLAGSLATPSQFLADYLGPPSAAAWLLQPGPMWCAWIAPGTRRRDGGRRTRMTSADARGSALRRRGGEPSTGRARRLPAGAWPAPAGGRSEPGADRRARQLRPCRQLLRLPGHAARRLAGGLAAHVGSDPELLCRCVSPGRLSSLSRSQDRAPISWTACASCANAAPWASPR